MMGTNVPTSVQDFRILALGGYVFADKTLLIRDILESGENSILFTRPRRFGKSLAISMLDRFLNVAYKEEETAEDSFAGLRISEYSCEYESVRNSCPVINLDMSDLVFDDAGEFKKSLCNLMRSLINIRFSYLQTSDRLDAAQRNCISGYAEVDDAARAFNLSLSVRQGCFYTRACVREGHQPGRDKM